MRPSNSIIVSNVSGSNSFSSSACWATDIIRCSFAAVVSSGTLAGTFTLQGSNDRAIGATQILFQPTNWYTISSASTVVASTTASSLIFAIPPTEVCSEYLRVIFTKTAGAQDSAVSINFVAKAL